MDISVVIPLLDEEESLQELNDWIVKIMQSNHFLYEIIYIDDGSGDRSWSIIEHISKNNENVRGIRFRRNYGKSAALNSAFEVCKGDVVITMDADLQDSPEEIPELFKMIKEDGFDLVSGWKKKRNDPIKKRWPSKIYNRINRMITGIKLHDFNCGLKAYKREVIKTIEIYGEMHRFVPVIAKWAGFKKIGEKVVNHSKRKFGKSKFGLERYRKGFLDLISIIFVSRFGKRPMHLFGSLGTLLFIAGFGIAVYLIYAKLFLLEYKMTDRPLFYFGLLSMVLGTQLFLAGFLAEMISRTSSDRNKYHISKEIGFKN
jgi:glycosyltransferase involved in cell wall biosynthesis